MAAKPKPKTMTVTEFRAKCLRLVDELGPDGVVLTKRGKVVARVLPADSFGNRDLIGCMKGRIRVKGPIYTTGKRTSGRPRRAHPSPHASGVTGFTASRNSFGEG